jgi:hypothetical protein
VGDVKDQIFHEALELLQEAQRESVRNAQGRAEELVDRAVKRLQQGLDDKSISNRELFDLLSQIIAAIPSLAELVNTILQKLA